MRNLVLNHIPGLLDNEDDSIVANACEAIFYITNISKDDTNKPWVDKVMGLLLSQNLEIYFPCLKTIGNLVISSDEIIKKLLNFGILDLLQKFMESTN